MRHRKAGRKFKRSPEHRRMLLRNLATSLFEHGRITTTLAKAKETQPYAEELITLARRGLVRQAKTEQPDRLPLAELRRALAVITKKDVVYKLFHEIGPRFADRPGGYTRIYKLPMVRQGDCAPMAVLCLIGDDEPKVSEKAESASEKKKAAATA
jgi:large subunit ribosomal protein L17